MQLTRYTDYALRVLLYLAVADPEQRVTVADIADRYGIARNHLLKVVHKLGQLGYLRTIRGKGGGILLDKQPAQINLGQVIRDMEARLDIIDCNAPPCPLQGACQLKTLLNQAASAFLTVLDQHSLAELCQAPEQTLRLLQLRN